MMALSLEFTLKIPIVKHHAEPGVLLPRSPVKNSQHASGSVAASDPTALLSSDHPAPWHFQ